MGTLLKIIIGGAGILLGLLLVAVIALPMLIDPNDHKDRLIALVENETGRTLEIDGDISLSVFPWLGADIGQTRLGNAEGFKSGYMATMEGVEVRIRLLPLLRKAVEIDTIRLTGLELNLEKDAQGRSNLDDLLQAGESKPGGAQAGAADSDGIDLEHLEIGGVDIDNARLSWDDRAAKQHYELSDLTVSTGKIEAGESFDLDVSFRASANDPAVDSRVTLAGEIRLADELKGVTVSGARLDVYAEGAAIPGSKVDLALATDINLDLQQGTLSLPALTLSAWNLTLDGSANGSGLNGDAPEFNGRLSLAQFSPRELLKLLGQADIETADSKALAAADASMDWTASGRHFAADRLQLHLDETTASGKLRVDSFESPAISFGLDVDRLNVDRYLPPAPAEGDARQQPAAAAGAGGELPVEALRRLNLKGTARIREMTAINLKYRDAEVTINASNGVVRLHPFGANMYDGSYRGDITLDVRKSDARLSVNEKVSSVQAGPLLNDLMSFDKLQGQADMTARFTARGITPESIKRTLNGNAAFTFRDGAVKGVNIASLIRKAQAKLKGQPAPPDDMPNQTDFALLNGTVNVTDGLARNDDLTLQSPFLRVTGKGETHLAEETISYLLTTKLVGSLEGQGGKSLEELKGVAIPVRVGGTYSKPTYTPDLGAALSEAARAKVEEKVEKQKEKIKEKIGEKLGDELLKGLFR